MKEIGGYFELDNFINQPYHKDVIELNTCRNALMYLIRAKNIKKIYIPYFLCSSISNVLKKNLVEFEYYHIDEEFMPKFDLKLQNNEYVYIVNYYGQFDDEKISGFKRYYGNIVVDNTQAFFQKPISGVDTLYSCRKFFGVPDGAYLSSLTISEDDLEIDQSRERMEHILGRYEVNASDFFEKHKDNDANFKGLPLRKMSKLTRNILGAIDYDNVQSIRNENYLFLFNQLSYSNGVVFRLANGAFAYPFYVKNGPSIRKKLVKKNIYIPTLWPNVLEENSETSVEYDYAANILPLPCDQRYTIEDMKFLVKELKKCLG